MKLVTRRMTLMALEPGQLTMLARNDIPALEKNITLTYHAEPLEGEFRASVIKSARLVEKDEDNYLWYTIWVLNLGREMIGSVSLKGLPAEDGTVRITCGMNQDFRGNGYATEAVGKLAEWVLRQPDVERVAGMVEKNNTAAHRIFEKNQFVKFKETDTQVVYVKERHT